MGIRKPSMTVEEARQRAERGGVDASAKPPPVLLSPEGNRTTPVRKVVLETVDTRRGALHGNGRQVADGLATSQAHLIARTAQQKQKRMTADGDEKQQLFLSVAIPAPGVSASFDLLTQSHTPTKAVQLILRRALSLYEENILDGSFVALQMNYDIDNSAKNGVVVQTSRTMNCRIVEIAREYFDPLGFESDRAFGRKLATAALAAFFQQERTRSS